MSIVSECWEELDRIMDQLMDPTKKIQNPPIGTSVWRSVDDQILHERLKGEARGMAKLLAKFMVPFFRTADEIAKEARVRYEKRLAGEHHTTVGLAERAYEFPSDDKYKSKPPVIKGPISAPVAAPRKRAAPRKSPVLPFDPLSAEEKASIMKMKGLMTEDELAMIYKTRASVIRALWAEG